MMMSAKRLGSTPLDAARTEFRVWAPAHDRVQLRLVSPREFLIDMTPEGDGYHTATIDAGAGAQYFYRLSTGADRPDPASRLQPQGVHGPSAVVTAPDSPQAAFDNPPLDRHIIYELHIGTFTPEGTFDAAITRLDDLASLGITAIELMPIAEFPGARNWGYDGVGLFAAHHAYGGPAGLRRLVDAAHARGLAVFLDVVYNHLGPEGNHLAEFGPYFTDRYRTPWGSALNFDGPGSDEVRRFFIQNALYWTGDFRIDGLRLDAVHAIVDTTPTPFLEELAAAVHAAAAAQGRRVHLIAESSDNDPRLIRPSDSGGLGLDAVWSDDFHHALRTLLTAERSGYYADYGALDHLSRALAGGFAYTGQHSAVRSRRHGRPATGARPSQFVVCSQNHDQVGNRMLGDRLGAAAGFEGAKLAAGLTLLSPFTPLLFMGEEYAEPAPFQYFVSHTDSALVEAVRRGRRDEFASFAWAGDAPDPQSEDTFQRSKLDWSLRASGRHRQMLAYYAALLRLRRSEPALAATSLADTRTIQHPTLNTLAILRGGTPPRALILANFESSPVPLSLDLPRGDWTLAIDSTDAAWGGPGAPGATHTPVSPLSLPPRSLSLYLLRS